MEALITYFVVLGSTGMDFILETAGVGGANSPSGSAPGRIVHRGALKAMKE
jgi:hypothetical protein